ncbi:MAG: triple tyrosine motif-containing protein [Bacteroidota bacterium]
MNLKYLFLFVLISFPGLCQELPPVINFNPNQYNAGNQNWNISQHPNRNIYVANSTGLLEYTGAEWNLYPMPNNTIVRSVQVAGDKIFTGAYMEIGYWEKNSKGVLEYTSLMPNFPGEVNDGEQFWHMEYMGDVLVFQSFEGLYLCNLKTLEISRIETPPVAITNLFKGDRSIYFQMMAAGLFTIKKNQPEMVISPDVLIDIEIMHVAQNGSSLQLISRDGNFYVWDGQELSRKYLQLSEKLRNQSIYSAYSLADNSLILGTVEQGIYHIDINGNILFHFNQKNGLINNTVLDLFVDRDNNVWAGLDNGLSIINLDSAFMLYQDNYGNLGSVYTSLQTEDFLYVGTNQGLYFKRNDDEIFTLMDGTNGQVWSLQLIGTNLFCGHNNGTYIVNGEVATRVFDGSGTWVVKNYEGNPGYYLQGHYNGISLLKEENGNFNFMGMVENFPHSTKFLVSEKGGDIWAVNEHKGVYRIQMDFPSTKVSNIDNYTFEGYSGINSSIFKFNDTLYYSSKEKLFQFQESENKFNTESRLGSLFDEFDLISGRLINTSDNVLWGFLNDAVINIETAQLNNTYKMGMVHLPKDLRNITLGYENITLLDNDSYLLGVSNGYLKFEKDFNRNLDYEIKIDKIFKSALDESPELIDLNDSPPFHYKTNNISFEYSIPEYKKFISPVYSYRLLGLSPNWSSWTESSSVDYTNLSFGDYEFQVKAKMGNQELDPVIYYFEVSRPWFLSYFAIAVYITLLFIAAYFINKGYKRKHLRLIREKEKELKLQNLEVEKRIIELQNEQLEKEMTGKNKELAVSTMSLIKKNEFLSSIKDKLKESKETSEVRSVIRTIDKDISEEDNWNFFKEAFNNADKDFFKKMKSRHPNLTANDLKLCAYLRLNLSSKEIAPLLNISVKSVEIKRYRLRKKMELTHDSSLVDYILEV